MFEIETYGFGFCSSGVLFLPSSMNVGRYLKWLRI